ncbi:FMN-linked oxidoreductase [Coniophora puteana RWD-64-598 SS2]|uniref:FMN-linked oxidoreductase n=1 Tax=Coniophora puteana (strain RWD-64-598) TaxID=741705 RepID=A0A5M3MNU7_CONPW|nr:FMN-linked oxidoreductase [Coniophora puteana RWD-64-598 SS2]EIW80405.1 FMN-linked oxidoreductase [Coniophora puteana RWD-64-598 SS2]
MTDSQTPALFRPIRVGELQLQHRVVLAPMTRVRAHNDHVPGPHAAEYYSQRTCTHGTLLITDSTSISPKAGGLPYLPGVWSEPQIAAGADVRILAAEGGFPLVGPSDIPNTDHIPGGGGVPRPLTTQEIKEYVEMFVIAAKNAMQAGFDGVEIHGANGWLIDQFLQDVSYNRTDEYGGSVENRSRFALEVVDAVVAAIGGSHTYPIPEKDLSAFGDVHIHRLCNEFLFSRQL